MRYEKISGENNGKKCINKSCKKLTGLENKMSREYDDNNKAVNIVWKEFEKIHPKETRPDWLENYITVSGNKNQNKNWVIRILLMSKMQLKPDQHLEWGNDGIPIVVRVDPVTGKRFMVICDGPADGIKIIFEAEVDFANDLVKILIDTNLNTLDNNKYQVLRMDNK